MVKNPYGDFYVSFETVDGKKGKCHLGWTPDALLHFFHPADDSVILVGTNIFPQVYRDLRISVSPEVLRAINSVIARDGYMDRINHYYQNPLVSVMNGLPVKEIVPPANHITGFVTPDGRRSSGKTAVTPKKLAA